MLKLVETDEILNHEQTVELLHDLMKSKVGATAGVAFA
jgi:hypothetical protein